MIWEFYNIFQDIMNYYQTSKLPKMMKVLVCRSRMRKLIKVMKKAKKLEYYTWSDICMLLKILELENVDQPDRYIFTVDDDDNISQLDITFSQEHECMDITCTIMYDGNSVRSMMLGLKDSNPDHSGNTDISRSALEDLNDIVRLYIDKMADNLNEEAERIYAS